LVEFVQACSECNPFFILEILKALIEQGTIDRQGGVWQSTGLTELRTPRSVRSAVRQRVGRLAPEGQDLLNVASVVGQVFDLDILLIASFQSEAEVLDELDAALGAHLIEERREGRADRYAFVHALIQQTLYEELPSHRSSRLHLRVGEALEGLPGRRPEAAAELGCHFIVGGDAQRAVQYLDPGWRSRGGALCTYRSRRALPDRAGPPTQAI
jgi:predicted ATPase